ncbi:hypothetical protein EK21DRAFT_89365 [Setomelanomma holmii]|uniref:Uncharacterized protein n=1 Tax=Setomelanomma holmii TaxID=210430 RepID=A0A9P4HB82_9PLEO|nr:hypothetical protein EK21DRAFT_89365 [Setomelanomma holmii]
MALLTKSRIPTILNLAILLFSHALVALSIAILYLTSHGMQRMDKAYPPGKYEWYRGPWWDIHNKSHSKLRYDSANGVIILSSASVACLVGVAGVIGLQTIAVNATGKMGTIPTTSSRVRANSRRATSGVTLLARRGGNCTMRVARRGRADILLRRYLWLILWNFGSGAVSQNRRMHTRAKKDHGVIRLTSRWGRTYSCSQLHGKDSRVGVTSKLMEHPKGMTQWVMATWQMWMLHDCGCRKFEFRDDGYRKSQVYMDFRKQRAIPISRCG